VYALALLALLNAARLDAGVSALAHSDTLAQVAGLEAEWLVFAQRHKLPWAYHVVDTDWLLESHPDLAWERLDAVFPDGPPDYLGVFNLAQLCGYSGACLDNIGRATRKPEDAVIGWLRSPNHKANMLDPRWTECGVAKRGGGQSAIVVAVFGSNLE
jgi:uncharacterized protein YkwD